MKSKMKISSPFFFFSAKKVVKIRTVQGLSLVKAITLRETSLL